MWARDGELAGDLGVTGERRRGEGEELTCGARVSDSGRKGKERALGWTRGERRAGEAGRARGELGCGVGCWRGRKRVLARPRWWAGGLLAQEERRGAPWAEEVGRERERRQADWVSCWVGFSPLGWFGSSSFSISYFKHHSN